MLNIVKIQRRQITPGTLQTMITIPSVIAKKIKHIEQINVKWNEEKGIIECVPVSDKYK